MTDERRIEALETGLASMAVRVEALEADRYLRDGGTRAWNRLLGWWGPITWTIGIIFTVLFLIARAAGVLHLPDGAVRAAPPAIERTTEGNEM